MKLRVLLTVSIFMGLVSSCRHELDCPGFDLEEDIMDWHITPGLESQISYIDSNSIEYTFNQTGYHMSEAYTFKCGGFQKCACSSNYLSTVYYNSDLNLTMNSTVFSSYNRITLEQDSVSYALNINVDKNSIFISDTLYTVAPIDTFTIFNESYMDVFEVSSQLNDFKFWLKKNVGMVAFEKNSKLYKLN